MDTSAALTSFDIIFLIVVGLSALFALFRGFIRELLSIVTWISASSISVYALPMVSKSLAPYIESPIMAKVAAGIGIFVVVFILFSLFTKAVLELINSANLGALDKTLGLVFGMVRGVAILALVHMVMTQVMAPQKDNEAPEWFAKAKSRPLIEASSAMLAEVVPEYLKEINKPAPSVKGSQLVNKETLDALTNSMASGLSGKLLENSVVAELDRQDRQTLKTIAESLPSDKLLYYTAELRRRAPERQAAYLNTIITSFRNNHTEAGLIKMGLSTKKISDLQKSLAVIGSANKTAIGYDRKDRDALNNLLEQVQ